MYSRQTQSKRWIEQTERGSKYSRYRQDREEQKRHRGGRRIYIGGVWAGCVETDGQGQKRYK